MFWKQRFVAHDCYADKSKSYAYIPCDTSTMIHVAHDTNYSDSFWCTIESKLLSSGSAQLKIFMLILVGLHCTRLTVLILKVTPPHRLGCLPQRPKNVHADTSMPRGGIKWGEGMGHLPPPPVGGSTPTWPQSEEKNGQNQPFSAIFGFLPPQNRILSPRCPPPPQNNFWCRHWVCLIVYIARDWLFSSWVTAR